MAGQAGTQVQVHSAEVVQRCTIDEIQKMLWPGSRAQPRCSGAVGLPGAGDADRRPDGSPGDRRSSWPPGGRALEPALYDSWVKSVYRQPFDIEGDAQSFTWLDVVITIALSGEVSWTATNPNRE